MDNVINSEQATELIIEKARSVVDQLIENRGHANPPFLPRDFARLLGVKTVLADDLGDTSGILLRFPDGYVIKVNQKHSLSRQGFSCAHEIGHILFSELKLGNYVNSIEHRRLNPDGEQKDHYMARERLCDAAATELLMPELVFKKNLSELGVSIYSVERLADMFKVSLQAAAIRMAEVSSIPCIAILWKPWPKLKMKKLKMAWCIGPGIKQLGGSPYVPVHINITNSSVIYKTYQFDVSTKCYKLFKRGDNIKRLLVESKSFGFGETRYVFSLAFVDQ